MTTTTPRMPRSVQYAYRSQNLLKLDNAMPALKSKLKYEKLASVIHVLQNTQNFDILRCCFAGDG